MPEYIQLENITKRFPGVTACNHISLGFEKGEIHALLGENGAGKTTLMNILYGLLKPDEGQIYIDGNPVQINGPQDATRLGIGMVHQHFMQIPKFTVLENIILGTKLETEPLLNLQAARQKVQKILDDTGLVIPLDTKIQDLCVGDQQRVEIIKALYKGAQTLIMDEPTSVLTPQETDELFAVLSNWTKSGGNTVIFITHKMREVVEICNRISILRDAKYIGTIETKDVDEDKVAQMMVGRPVSLTMEKTPCNRGNAILQIKDLKVHNDQGIPMVDGVSLDVHAGEIVGIAGVDGNGQLELIESIMGLMPVAGGDIIMEGKSIKGMTPGKVLQHGISNIPFRRQVDGLALNFSISDNYILKEHNREPFAKNGFLQWKYIREKTTEIIEKYRVKANGPDTRVGNMSGGNQQKVVIARELEREHKLLIACHPTHGLDIGAIEFIHKTILAERDLGRGIILVSTELDELLSLSDRIIVMYKGAIMGETQATEDEVNNIGLMMLGNSPKAC